MNMTCVLCHYEIDENEEWGTLIENGVLGLDEKGTEIGAVHRACYASIFEDEEDDE